MSDQHQPAEELLVGGPDRPEKGGRRAYLLGGALAVLAVGGGAAAWAAVSFFGTGAQPAEALPASTLGYVSVDLDPSGSQKIEALKLARKFPAFKEQVGLDADDDVRKWIVEQIARDAECDIDFETDVEPWLGSRAAVAAVDGADGPFPVFVLQTTDAGKAETGLEALVACDGAESAWQIEGDWAVVAETEEQVEETVAATDDGALADDEDFQRWTGETGDAGILTAYAAPDAFAAVAALGEDLGYVEDSADVAPFGMAEACPGATAEDAEAVPGFEGGAATLRFSGDGLEVEVASSGGAGGLGGADIDVVRGLPEDTAAAIGFGVPEGWWDAFGANLEAVCGDDVDPARVLQPIAEMTGLDLPADVETLLGDGVALALGGGVDPEALINSSDPAALPLAMRLAADPEDAEAVLEKLRSGSLGQLAPELLQADAGDGGVALGFDPEFRAEVAADGRLGEQETFRDLVPDADAAAAVLYLNLDQLDEAMDQLAGGEQQVIDNLRPLTGLGASLWLDDGVSRARLKLLTD